MDDYSALAQRIAVSIREVRGCLILSRDGLVLGAFPDEEEAAAKSAWLRFCVLGEPERSFVEFPDQTWAFVKRGPYAAFAVAEAGVRPGVMVDQLEQILLTAEDGRVKRETLHLPDASAAPSGKPRTSLHPPAGRPEPAEPADQRRWSKSVPQVAGAEVPAVAASGGQSAPTTAPSTAPEPSAAVGRSEPAIAAAAAAKKSAPPVDPPTPTDAPPNAAANAAEGPVTALKKQPQKLVTAEAEEAEDADEVDPVMLAREFSRLLQMNADDDEGSS